MAPDRKASMLAVDPLLVSELTMMTGSGWCSISLRRNVSPSMRGISMSSVTTSGSCCRIRSRAMNGSAAVPTTSRSRSSRIASASIFRTMAESSTISTRSGRVIDI